MLFQKPGQFLAVLKNKDGNGKWTFTFLRIVQTENTMSDAVFLCMPAHVCFPFSSNNIKKLEVAQHLQSISTSIIITDLLNLLMKALWEMEAPQPEIRVKRGTFWPDSMVSITCFCRRLMNDFF